MSQGGIRKRKQSSEEIPLEKPVWFVALTIEEGKIVERTFNASKVQKKALLQFLVLSKCEKVYGVWNGQWNTDLIDMDISTLKKRLARDVQMTITQIKEEVKEIDVEFVKKKLEQNTLTEVANMLKMSRITLKKRLVEAGVVLQRGAKVIK